MPASRPMLTFHRAALRPYGSHRWVYGEPTQAKAAAAEDLKVLSRRHVTLEQSRKILTGDFPSKTAAKKGLVVS